MKAIVLLGAPGAGKGTTAEVIRETSPYVHVATGDILRKAMKSGSDLGSKAKGFVERGELVPDDVIIQLVEAEIDSHGQDTSVMFDGFPRTIRQAELLDEMFERKSGTLEYVFLLQAPRELLIQRLTGRRICRECGRNFHVLTMAPKEEGVCDLCGGELYQRPDDNEETIVNRLEVFEKQTQSLISYYEKKDVLVRIDSARERDELVEDVSAILAGK